MKKLINYINDLILTGAGVIATLRYFLFERGVIDNITKVCLLLIAFAGFMKVYFGWKLPIIDNFKTKPQRHLNLVEDDEFREFKKIKGGKSKMKNLWKYLIGMIRANKFTLTGNFSIIALYAILLDELFIKFGYKLINQPNEFYIRGGIYTLGLILALIAANGFGWERIEKWAARVNQKKLNKVVDVLLESSIGYKPELVDEKLTEAYALLEKIQPFIQEKLYNEIKGKLDVVNDRLRKYKANKVLEQERERQELLRLAQQEAQTPHIPNPPGNRGIMR